MQNHSTMSNIWFLTKKSYEFDKGLMISVIIRIPINVLLPLVTSCLTKIIVSTVSEQSSVSTMLIYIVFFSLTILLLTLINNYVTAKIKYDSMFNRLKFLNIIADKNMSADYQSIENPTGQLYAQKAKKAVYSSLSGVEQLFDQFVNIFSAAVGLATYSVIIVCFNVWVVLFLLVFGVVNYFVGAEFSKWQYKNRDNWTQDDHKLAYLNNKAGDYRAAKDIRLFNMSSWFHDMYSSFFDSRMYWYRKEENYRLVVNWFGVFLTFLRDGLAYGLLVYQMFLNQLDVSDFVFYTTIIVQYSVWIFGLMSSLVALKSTSYNVADIRQFLELPDSQCHDNNEVLPEQVLNITFDHVSFRYPDAKENTINDLSFSINKGEKIAIVGVNGAGKTTLVKLLCGLYTPSKGAIYINGTDICRYNKFDYYHLFSVVFQDIYIMPTTIEKNIAFIDHDDIDVKKLHKVLRLSGLEGKINELPQREYTNLVKGVQETGVDLSGGEMQKLALARALYKNGKIVVLDEPTASLDPIAENEIYQKYNELLSGRCSVYISHRLSSTQFCDNILLLENGRIVEKGNHEVLLKFQGKYAEMFELQSQYYKEGFENEYN